MSANDSDVSGIYSLIYSVKFAVLVSLIIPSILVSLLIFIYFSIKRRTHVNDRNHSILLLLIINFVQVVSDLPMAMNFFRLNGLVQPATSVYCVWWIWYEFSLNTIIGYLMAWISIERHLLIFHSNSIRNLATWKRQVLHIAPLVVCIVWGPSYYLLTVIISPMCTNTRYFDSLLCGLPCYLFTYWGAFDLLIDVIGPVLILFLGNLALFLRIVHQNMAVIGRVGNNWRRQRKMALQLGLISFVYLVVWIPLSIIQLGETFLDSTFLLTYLDAFNYLVYIVPLILPMICLLSMPEVLKALKNLLFPQRNTAIIPLNMAHTRQNNIGRPANRITVSKF